MSSSSTCTQRSADASILIAHWPIARIALRTKSTSTSDAYLSRQRGLHKERAHSFSSLSSVSTFFSAARRIMMSSFSTLT